MDYHIYSTEDEFNFKQISISQPSAIQGGAYVTKINYNGNPLYIQTPKCLTKQGLNETNKKAYIDLMYSSINDQVIEWFENLETTLINLIHEKRQLWFQNDMDLEDIESFFNPITRAYKGGKYHLIRMNIPRNKSLNSKYSCNVYDETENIIPIQELNDTQNIIPCLEIHSIKFSAKNFQVELIGKQIMVLNNKPLFNSCIIKRNNTMSNQSSSVNLNKNIENDNITETNTNNEISTMNTINTDSLETMNSSIIPHQHENNNSIQTNDDDNDDDNADDDDDDNKLPDIATITQSFNTGEDLGQLENLDQSNNLDESEDVAQTEDVIQSEDVAQRIDTYDSNQSTNTQNIENTNEINEHSQKIELNNSANISNDLEDISNDISIKEMAPSITLNNPNEVYYEIYKIAKQKAREHKKAAISHYLEAKKIKNTYLLDDLYNSDNSSSDEEIDSDSDDVKNQINEIIEEL